MLYSANKRLPKLQYKNFLGKATEQIIVKSHPEEMLQFQSLSEIDKTGKSKIHVLKNLILEMLLTKGLEEV